MLQAIFEFLIYLQIFGGFWTFHSQLRPFWNNYNHLEWFFRRVKINFFIAYLHEMFELDCFRIDSSNKLFLFLNQLEPFWTILNPTSWAVLVSNSLFNWSCKVSSDFSNFGWWVTMLGIMGDHPWEAGDNIWEGDFE